MWYINEDHSVTMTFPENADLTLYLRKDLNDFKELDVDIENPETTIYQTTINIEEEGNYTLKVEDNNSNIFIIKEFKAIKKEVFTDNDRTTLNTITSNINLLLDIEQGNWQIKDKQMIFYNRVGDELMRFNLFDKNNIPSEKVVYKRERV